MLARNGWCYGTNVTSMAKSKKLLAGSFRLAGCFTASRTTQRTVRSREEHINYSIQQQRSFTADSAAYCVRNTAARPGNQLGYGFTRCASTGITDSVLERF